MREHQKDAEGDAANHFHTALYQYSDLFEWEIIDTFHGNRDEVIHALNVAEEYHILKCNSTDERFGYNATKGGYSSDKFAEYIKRRAKAMGGRAKAVLQYDADGNFAGRFLCALDAEKATGIRAKYIIGSSKGKCPQDVDARRKRTDFFFFRDTENYPKKIDVLRTTKQEPEKNKENPAIAVMAYDPKSGAFVVEYTSMSEAHKKSGVAPATIRRSVHLSEPVCVKSPLQKYVWRRKEGEIKASIEIIPYEVKTIKRKKMEHRVIQYSLRGEFIKVWENTNIAADSQTDNYSAIYSSLKGKQGKKTNYIWRYYSDNYPNKLPANNTTNTDGTRKESVRKDDTILEVNKAGEVIAAYKNTSDAAERSGFSQSYICNVLAGRIRHPKRRFKRP